MEEIVSKGDTVTIEVTGELGDYTSNNYGGHVITDADGAKHVIYLGAGRIRVGRERGGVKVISSDKHYPAYSVWQDADGDIVIRTEDNRWLTAYGVTQPDSWPSKPLRRMVPEQA